MVLNVRSFDDLLREQFGPNATFEAYASNVLDELFKAFGTGLPGAPTGAGDASSLRLLNLDATMSSVLFTERHIKLFNWLPRVLSPNAYYEWNQRMRYGSGRGLMGFAEGGAPRGSTASYQRRGAYVKYLGVRRGVTHQLALAGQLGGYQLDPVAEEHRNGTLELLEKIERHLFFGDASIHNKDGVEVHYDGLLRQLRTLYPAHVIDKQGAPMAFEDFEQAAYELYQVGKLHSFENVTCFMSPFVLSDLSNLKLQAERKLLGATAEQYLPGVPLKGYNSNYGFMPFEPTIFFERVESNAPPATADPGAPAAPAQPTVAAANDTTSKLALATTYYYVATAIGESGESLGSPVSAAATTDAVTRQNLTVTIPRVTDTECVGYRLYRGSLADGSDARWVADIPQPPSGNATYVDRNQQIPGTGYVAILERSPENLVIAQLTPLLKFPLAVVSTTVEFLLLLYHTLVMKIGERQIIYVNVGRQPA